MKINKAETNVVAMVTRMLSEIVRQLFMAISVNSQMICYKMILRLS